MKKLRIWGKSLEEYLCRRLNITKILDFQLTVLLKTDSFIDSFQKFTSFLEKHFERIPLTGCFWYFYRATQIQNSQRKRSLIALMVSIFYLLIILIPYKTQQWLITICRFWVTCTYKNLKIVYVKFTGKFGIIFGSWLSVRYRESLKINLLNP